MEVKLNFVGFRCIRESIERLLRCGFNTFDNTDDPVNLRLIDQTLRSINEQPKVFVKLNVRRKIHRSLGFSLLSCCDFGGLYGSAVPGAISGCFFRLCSNSTATFMAGPAIHELRNPVCGYSSFGSVMRSNAFGLPSFVGDVHQSRSSS